ncbi:MAG: glycosyltransferase family protein [Parachlamydiaceae bacterium]|nr:glycosyltransferase family protein [Parachlamydiaceae bacterium]
MRTVVIMQARMGSTRLPGKLLKEVLGKPLLLYQIERLQRVTLANEIVVATTTNPIDHTVIDFCHSKQIPVFQGSENDVLDRYFQAAKYFEAEVIVRVSGDCPLIDQQVVDKVIDFYKKNYPRFQYVSNTLERSYPRGMDVEVFSFSALEKAATIATRPEQREHVTPYIYQHPELFALGNVAHHPNESHYRWTVDTIEDFQLITAILENLYPKKPNFSMYDILEAFKEHPEWININAHVQQKPLT